MFYRVHYEVGDRKYIRDFFTKESADFELTFCKDKKLQDGSLYSAVKMTKVKERDYVGGKYLDGNT
jgi:hypothetical protein